MKQGITLVGMPGAGKSAIGKRVAAKLGWKYLDLDDYIGETQNMHHHEFMLANGEQALMDLEQKLTMDLDLTNMIFAPGGSIIFSTGAMQKIKEETTVIYIKISLNEVRDHLGDKMNRNGIIGLEEKGIDGVFEERTPLYEKYADITFDFTGNNNLDEKVQIVMEKIQQL